MIKMIVTDLDGTLLAGKSNLPEENIRALCRAMDAGVQVVISSGRMIEATLPIAEAIGVNAPLSLFNGAMVYDYREDKILRGHPMPRETAVKVLQAIEEMGGYAHAFPGRGYYLNQRCEWTDFYENKINIRGTEVGMPLSQWLKSDVYKLLCIGPGAQTNAIMQALAPRFPELNFAKSSAELLEIVAGGVDKASGMRDLSEITGIQPEEMMAFGDEMNDLPMLKFAGTAIAMENAAEGVKKEIRLMAPKNTACGVAKIVNLYLDEGKMGGKDA